MSEKKQAAQCSIAAVQGAVAAAQEDVEEEAAVSDDEQGAKGAVGDLSLIQQREGCRRTPRHLTEWGWAAARREFRLC